MPLPGNKDFLHGVILVLLGLTVAAVVIWTVLEGGDFYATQLVERPHHEDFRRFRPAGPVGHWLGVAGSGMVLLLLTYSLRKRRAGWNRLGQLRIWLRYHIFLGIAGPVLITLHTSFRVSGLVAVSFWSMAAVALSGVFGRYLYQQLPRNLLGNDLSLEEFEAQGETLLVELSELAGMDEQGLRELEEIALGPFTGKRTLLALPRLPLANVLLPRRLADWSPSAGRALATDQVRSLARRWILLRRRSHFFHLVRDLFHWWHVLHKPFAVIMIIIMLVHVVLAIALGYNLRY